MTQVNAPLAGLSPIEKKSVGIDFEGGATKRSSLFVDHWDVNCN